MPETRSNAADPNQAAGASPHPSGTAEPIGAGTITDAPLTLTQAAIDAMIQKRIAEVKVSTEKALREQYGDFEQLKQKASQYDALMQSEMTELERAQKDLADKDALLKQREQEANEAKLHALRLEVGQTKGLSPLLSSRLQGVTREELEADAENVLKELGPNRPKPPNLDATAGVGQGEGGTRTIKLTPEQEAILAKVQRTDPTMTRDRYIKGLLREQAGD
jgi:hypothetical protein